MHSKNRKRLLLLGLAIILLLQFPIVAISQIGKNLIISNAGAIVPRTVTYLMVNSTGTYELDGQFGVVYSSGKSLQTWNHAIADVSALRGSLFVYNGTYNVDGAIVMRSDVNITLQDGVYLNETVSGQRIFQFWAVSNSFINADTNATIHGEGSSSSEHAFWFLDCDDITIRANHPNGLAVFNIGGGWLDSYEPSWVNTSLFQNINATKWNQANGIVHGMTFDGLQDSQIINVTSLADELKPYTRSCLVIGGDAHPSNNVTIIGGLYANSTLDNGIYLGGWNYPVTNIQITNVTTANNNLANSSHSGLKFRPASNVTVTGWVSINDYNGMEMDSVYDSERNTANTGGSWYNNISGTIYSPRNCGLILDLDGSNKDQSVRFNNFNLTVYNGTKPSIWVDNSFPGSNDIISNNTIFLTSVGSKRQAIDFSSSGGAIENFTVYGIFIQNGKDGFPDISFENIVAQKYNVINVYSTSGNPNGLYLNVPLGTNTINYPYTG